MLIVYLDQNVYQDLKKEENKHLVTKMLAAREYLLFCFSEAHLFDLSQDKSDEKFKDMDFIASIAENNCFVFDDQIKLIDKTPRQYYDDYDWSDTFNIHEIDDPIWEQVKGLLESIPFEFQMLLNGVELPDDMPDDMKKLLLEPITMYDFMLVMIDLTENLSNEQKKFKKLIQYLHNNSLQFKLYEGMGISGYDGENITDRAAFYNSYIKQFIKDGQNKSQYELYMDMYNGLEFYGLVKGKPKKQKMMNLINDAKHSFFGTVCDVVVSKDVDFLAKSLFMYKVEGLGIKLLPFFELESFLDEQAKCYTLTIETLSSELAEPFYEEQVIFSDDVDGIKRMFAELKNLYYSYFNVKGIVFDVYGHYWTIHRKLINHINSPLKLQLRHIVSRLNKDLGEDVDQKGEYVFSEQVNDKSIIRTWILEDVVISLILDGELYLSIYELDYLKMRKEKKNIEID